MAAISRAEIAQTPPAISKVAGAPMLWAIQPAQRLPKGASPKVIMTQMLRTRPRISGGTSVCTAVLVIVVDITALAPKTMRIISASSSLEARAKAMQALPPTMHKTFNGPEPCCMRWLNSTTRIEPTSAPMPAAAFSSPRPCGPMWKIFPAKIGSRVT